MPRVRRSSQPVRVAALALSLVLTLGFSQPAQADPPAAAPPLDSSDPISVLVAGNPSELLTLDAAGKIAPNPKGLHPRAAEVLSDAARTLNEASAAGYLSVSPDFAKVEVTAEGREYVENFFEGQSAGCYQVTAVSADWLGFHVALESECTSEELAERLGIPAPDPNPPLDGRAVATFASYAGDDSEPIITASHSGDNCAAAIVSYSAALIGLFILLAAPPAGWLYWVALSASGVGWTYVNWSLHEACFGLRDVDYRYRAGSYEARANCTFYSNWNWGYSGHGNWVPRNERWNCPA